MSQRKQELIDKLCSILHQQARSLGYACAAIGDAGYRQIDRMTCKQLEHEIGRLEGKVTIDQLPASHVCINVG